MKNSNNRIALIVIGVVALIWLMHMRKPSPSTQTLQTKETEANRVHNGSHASGIMLDTKQSASSPCVHHHKTMVEPIDSTFKPTPNACPYHE